MSTFGVENALIVGASGAIGKALVTEVRKRYPEASVWGSARSALTYVDRASILDVEHPKHWQDFRDQLQQAAHNMFIKSASLEFKRRHLMTSVLALHPGTTESELSAPFTRNLTYPLTSPAQSAELILDNLQSKLPDNNGSFYNWDGREILW